MGFSIGVMLSYPWSKKWNHLIFLAPAVLIYFYWKDFLPLAQDMLKHMQGINLSYVLIAFLLYILSVFLFAKRWKIVLHSLGYNLQTLSLIPAIFGAISINNLTPANRMGGEPLRLLWIRKQFGVAYSDAFVSIVYERVIEAIPVVIMAAYALSALLPHIPRGLHPLKTALYPALILLLLIAVYYLFRAKLNPLLGCLKKYPRPLRRAFMPTLLFSSAVWGLDVIRLKLVNLALGIQVPITAVVALSLLYLVLGLIPLTPGGLGIVDGGLVTALTMLNVPLSAAIDVVAVERFISYGLSSAIGALCLLYFGGLKIWRNTGSPS